MALFDSEVSRMWSGSVLYVLCSLRAACIGVCEFYMVLEFGDVCNPKSMPRHTFVTFVFWKTIFREHFGTEGRGISYAVMFRSVFLSAACRDRTANGYGRRTYVTG